MLQESFGQLWGCTHECWAQRFFENWRDSLEWQRLKPYKVALGFVEGLNNSVRVIQRRAYGPRDEDYLRLEVQAVSPGPCVVPCTVFTHSPPTKSPCFFITPLTTLRGLFEWWR